jgi:hypothetical protein
MLGARFLGCTQERCLVLLVRNTGEAEKLRIPSVISAMLSAVCKVLLFPSMPFFISCLFQLLTLTSFSAKPLYKVVNKWLTAKPKLDLMHVPLFHTLMNSSSTEVGRGSAEFNETIPPVSV